MPVIKSAKKKLRKDKKVTKENKALKALFKDIVSKAVKKPTEINITKAIKIIDKTAKKHIIHENKAARIKSRLSKLLNGKGTISKANAPAKKKVIKKIKKTSKKNKK
jgi:small subunit ribosomal protein S20